MRQEWYGYAASVALGALIGGVLLAFSSAFELTNTFFGAVLGALVGVALRRDRQR
jgi:hypothetical protein